MVILVGDKPSPKMKEGAKPFEGAACEKRLRAWIQALGIKDHILVNSYSGHDWDYALEILDAYDHAPIIALGKNASKRLDSECLDHFKMPHPSGRNRLLNDKSFIAGKLIECKKWLDEYAK